MPTVMVKFLIVAVALCLPLFAAAAPGFAATGFAVTPQDAPKLIAAIDAYMASDAGKQFKGRLMLFANIADGADPSTHSIVSIFHSAAELEAFDVATVNSPARKVLMDTVVPISTLELTSRATTLRSWGDIVDTDKIWNGHYFNVMDPQAFNAAQSVFLNSPAGKRFPGQAHLAATSAGGIGAPTHTINVGYASIAEMEAYDDSIANDPDWIKYLAALGAVSEYLGSDLSVEVKSWGPATIKSLSP